MQPLDYLPDPKTGLHLPASDRPNLRVGIENWITVERIENASGKVSKRRRFPNLLLNRGLDEHFKSDLLDLGDYGAASEDATAPVATDTTLGTEALRDNATGGIVQTVTEVANGHIKVVTTRQLASDGNYNIRKVGFSQSGTPGGTVNVAEQIKDAGGNPDVVTLDATQSLRQSWECHYYFAPIASTAGSVQVAGFPGQSPDPATRTGDYAIEGNPAADTVRFISAVLRGLDEVSFLWMGLAAMTTSQPLGWGANAAANPRIRISALNTVWSLYADGDYFRELDVTIPTGDLNTIHQSYGLVNMYAGNDITLYSWNFDAGQAPTKDDLGKVTVKLPRFSLARRP